MLKHFEKELSEENVYGKSLEKISVKHFLVKNVWKEILLDKKLTFPYNL